MKLKLDENLPEELLAELTRLRHEVDSVRSEGVAGEADPKVWQAAQGSGRFLITQDLDFSDARQFAPGTHHGLLLVRLRSPGRRLLTRSITELFRTNETESWAGCFVVLTDHKTADPASARLTLSRKERSAVTARAVGAGTNGS